VEEFLEIGEDWTIPTRNTTLISRIAQWLKDRKAKTYP